MQTRRMAVALGAGLAFWALTAANEPAASIFDESQLKCLALNIYWEARSETEVGQRAVAHVTLNRVNARKFPNTVCDVIQQGTETGKRTCQFSWNCDGANDHPSEPEAWDIARRYALEAMAGDSNDPTDGALFYHTKAVNPKWAKRLDLTQQIGAHLFYNYGDPQLAEAASTR